MGAGPAGAAAAFFLSDLSEGKLNVLSLEKLDSNFDRYHRMCGEAMSKKAFDELAPLAPEAVTFNIKRAVEHWPGNIVIRTETPGYVLDRPAFIRSVLDRAKKEGCHLEKGAATSIVKDGNGYLVRTKDGWEIRSKWIVGADGWNSLVRRTFFEGAPRMLWTEQYVTGVQTEKDVMSFYYDQKYLGGYRWVFPHPKGSRVGFTKGTDMVPEALERHVRPIPYDYHSFVKGGACLVGDSAGQANPITFGGIRQGMVAAKMMASSLVNGGLDDYERKWRRSKRASTSYVKAFDALKLMDNDALERSMGPFRSGYGRRTMLRAMLSGKETRKLYQAYALAAEWGW
ncbi:MAG: NAD(P)/FAD-dependent oxidoreductase [Methanomassiliicoccales archaeon]|nr:NAD(P)/FAD-dependent oxidoreductase [Methanomassiliicoccales archaeon]